MGRLLVVVPKGRATGAKCPPPHFFVWTVEADKVIPLFDLSKWAGSVVANME